MRQLREDIYGIDAGTAVLDLAVFYFKDTANAGIVPLMPAINRL